MKENWRLSMLIYAKAQWSVVPEESLQMFILVEASEEWKESGWKGRLLSKKGLEFPISKLRRHPADKLTQVDRF